MLIILLVFSTFSANATSVNELKNQLSSKYMILVNRDFRVSSDYVPADLVTYPGSSYRLERKCSESLKKMIDACAANGGERLVLYSGYRSYQTQYNKYYGKINQYIASGYSKAQATTMTDQYYAPPGGSEHHTGLAADICTPSVVNKHGQLHSSFGTTAEGKWLRNNCYKYGFILRYDSGKEGITGYNYEPWHFRYVGTEHATKIFKSKLTYEEYITDLKKTASDLSTAPAFTVNSGKITLSAAKGTQIRYTDNNTVPKADSKVYAGPLSGKDVTYKAIVCKNGYTSAVSTITVTEYGDVFCDISTKDWFYQNVSVAVHQGVFNGLGNYEFAPNDTMTRAMMVQVLANISGTDLKKYDGKTKYTDVRPSKWYAPAIDWASENGIVQGMGDGIFAPEASITREQACVIFYNHSGKSGTEPLPFTDSSAISSWAQKGVAFCAEKKIVNGYPDGTFRPSAGATRAEMAKMTLIYTTV